MPPPCWQDIKAGNVMLDGAMRAKVCDFGLAVPFSVDTSTVLLEGEAAPDAAREISKSSFTCGVGTLRYMAPEVLQRTDQAITVHYDEAADVYSYGLFVWELAHGTTPFDGHKGLYVASVLVPRDHRPPLNLPMGLEPLEELITHCWHRLPAKRPTMAECVDAVGVLLSAVERRAELESSAGGVESRAELESRAGGVESSTALESRAGGVALAARAPLHPAGGAYEPSEPSGGARERSECATLAVLV